MDRQELDTSDNVGEVLPSRILTSFAPDNPQKEIFSDEEDPAAGIVVIVDPLSSGALLAKEFYQRGYEVVCVMSQKFPERLTNFVPDSCKCIKFASHYVFGDEPSFQEDLNKVSAMLLELGTVQVVLAGSETGIKVCDTLAERLGLPNNGPETSHVRRNKFLMGEQIQCAGLRSVTQTIAREWLDVEAFLSRLQPDPFKVVIKPIESAGSDDVSLCTSRQELQHRFYEIMGKMNVLGCVNEAVVVQEFLEGTEYVVDVVSKSGVHKVVAVWEYEKRPCNGASFVYFGMRLLRGASEVCKQLIEYQLKVLDCLNIIDSPSHGEVIMTKTGPCLVEVGARLHGGEGIWAPMAQACLGYTQITATILSVTRPVSFKRLPHAPEASDKCGMEVMLVSRVAGMLAALPLLGDLKQLATFHSFHLECKIDSYIAVTTNYLTTPGSVVLVGNCQAELERDFEAIRLMELDGFFVLK